ncbi:gamma-glutamylcyclotransferase [Nocardia colli]|uniref:Putative gamma-glutamylcyclotransferase n=1 Tax=Nocardia colli TaxID=2545717 RepID=A0A5N0E5I0_9NOCA|nr:gamma-glutamylcyclotransferase family protein [Nocardia colli]KAA8884672.1 gamma-glutamylcyclotransferase [Nocardia colli]
MEPSTRRWEQCAAQGYSLFVYGTLQFPEVLEVLIGRVPQRRAATASGWRVAALPGLRYPGLVPESSALARGLTLDGLTAEEWEILDAFEDDQYDLRPIPLASSADPAWTYIWTAPVAQDDWHPDHFAIDHLPHFVTQCAEWRRGL